MFHLLGEYSILAVEVDDARGIADRPAHDVVMANKGDYNREEEEEMR